MLGAIIWLAALTIIVIIFIIILIILSCIRCRQLCELEAQMTAAKVRTHNVAYCRQRIHAALRWNLSDRKLDALRDSLRVLSLHT